MNPFIFIKSKNMMYTVFLFLIGCLVYQTYTNAACQTGNCPSFECYYVTSGSVAIGRAPCSSADGSCIDCVNYFYPSSYGNYICKQITKVSAGSQYSPCPGESIFGTIIAKSCVNGTCNNMILDSFIYVRCTYPLSSTTCN